MTNKERKKRGGIWLRAAVASVAVLGVGGALTAASWSNQVTFQADALAVSIQGSPDGWSYWKDGNVHLNPMVFTSSIEGQAGAGRSMFMYVKNTSNVPVRVNLGAPIADGFQITPSNFPADPLNPGDSAFIRMEVRATADTPADANTTISVPVYATRA